MAGRTDDIGLEQAALEQEAMALGAKPVPAGADPFQHVVPLSPKSRVTGAILLVANFSSDVGYAWWLMENFWVTIARHYHGHGKRSILIYPRISAVPKAVAAKAPDPASRHPGCLLDRSALCQPRLCLPAPGRGAQDLRA